MVNIWYIYLVYTMDSVCMLHKYACLRGRATTLAEENGKFRTTTAIAAGASVCVAVCVAVCGKLHVQTTAASPSLKSSIGSRITITMSSAEEREGSRVSLPSAKIATPTAAGSGVLVVVVLVPTW